MPPPVPTADASGVAAVPVPEAGARTARGERTRARILEAARVAFGGVPWARARVEDVCREAGIGHGTFYAYYANKTAVLEALVRRHAAVLYGLAEQPWGGAPADELRAEVRAEVHRVISGFVSVSAADRDIREIWAAAAASEPALEALFGEVRAQFVARIRRALVAAAEAGLTRPDLDLEVAAPALAAMVEQSVALAGRTLPGAEGGREPEGDRLAAGLTDLWMHAVYR